MKYILIIFLFFSCPVFGQTYFIGDSVDAPNNSNEYVKIKYENFKFHLNNFNKDIRYRIVQMTYSAETATYGYVITGYNNLNTLLIYQIEINISDQKILIYQIFQNNDKIDHKLIDTRNYYARMQIL